LVLHVPTSIVRLSSVPLVVIVDKFCTHGSWNRKAGLTVVVMDRIRCAAECTILSGTYKHIRTMYKF